MSCRKSGRQKTFLYLCPEPRWQFPPASCLHISLHVKMAVLLHIYCTDLRVWSQANFLKCSIIFIETCAEHFQVLLWATNRSLLKTLSYCTFTVSSTSSYRLRSNKHLQRDQSHTSVDGRNTISIRLWMKHFVLRGVVAVTSPEYLDFKVNLRISFMWPGSIWWMCFNGRHALTFLLCWGLLAYEFLLMVWWCELRKCLRHI